MSFDTDTRILQLIAQRYPHAAAHGEGEHCVRCEFDAALGRLVTTHVALRLAAQAAVDAYALNSGIGDPHVYAAMADLVTVLSVGGEEQ